LQALKVHGVTTAAVMWPAWRRRDITYNISEIWSAGQPDDRIAEARKYATPGLVDDIERNATGKLDSTNMSEGCFSLDENAGRMAAYICKTYRPAFLALHFAEVDGFEHQQGRDGDSVRLPLESTDRAIGDVLEAIDKSGVKESTTVIIVGDDGFSTIHTIFRPNMLIKNLPVRIIAAGGSAFLYPDKEVAESDIPNIILSVTATLDSLAQDKRQLFLIVERSELEKMGADSTAILALAAVPDVVFSGTIQPRQTENHGPGTLIQQGSLDGVFIPTHGGHHGYDPREPIMYTGFIAEGAGIIKGGHIQVLCAPDVAPLVTRLLGVPFSCPDGKLVKGILR
jgi:predicted AlkP superfamily pyrophosphatase or phosphodiesterase